MGAAFDPDGFCLTCSEQRDYCRCARRPDHVARELYAVGEHLDDPGPLDEDDPEPSDDSGAVGEAADDAASVEVGLRHEVAAQRRRRDALRRLQAEDAPPFRALGYAAFLSSAQPEHLVEGLLYRDSLTRIYGKPGSCKSFLALDLAHRVALGYDFAGLAAARGPVVYVMAEGQRVNTQRTQAWLDWYATDASQLEGSFYAVPDAVMLTEQGAEPLVAFVARVGAALVILDTKNAMMVGDESSAADFAVLRRTMDSVRKASGACVVLIDHTGYEGQRARGSSAGTAAMDTEISVESDESTPQRITVKVTRDKAAEAGLARTFHLRVHDPAAVLVHDVLGERERPDDDSQLPLWAQAVLPLPDEVSHYSGRGAKLVESLARLMAHDAAPGRGDPNGVGVSRAEAAKALRAAGHIGSDDSSVRRAWSVLRALGVIKPAGPKTQDIGRHIWTSL